MADFEFCALGAGIAVQNGSIQHCDLKTFPEPADFFVLFRERNERFECELEPNLSRNQDSVSDIYGRFALFEIRFETGWFFKNAVVKVWSCCGYVVPSARSRWKSRQTCRPHSRPACTTACSSILRRACW